MSFDLVEITATIQEKNMELGVFLFKDIWIEVLLHRCLCPDVEG